jgi:sulfur-carrier protein adenylyltransferase/sulfurtransferase
VLPGVVGLVQATEAVKLILGIGEPLIGRLLTYDALGMRFREVRLRRDPHCPLCGTAPTIHDLSIHRESAGACEIAPNGHGEPATAATAAAPAQRAGG